MMKKTIFFCIFCCCFFSLASGQPGHLILTYQQNNEWLDSLSKLALDKKLRMITDRLLADTNIFVTKTYPDRINAIAKPGKRIYSESKPTIIINNVPLIIDNKTPNNKIIAVTELLNVKIIKEIAVHTGTQPATLAVYGSAGQSGIIIMTLKKKKFLPRLKKLKLIGNY